MKRRGTKSLRRSRIKSLLGYHISSIYLPWPSSLSLFLTPHCNLKCSMCWQYAKQGIFNSEKDEQPYAPLDFSGFSSLIDQVADFHPKIMLWGGEPLLSPSLHPLIQQIKKKSLALQIITNGTLIEKNADFFTSQGVNKIVISLDGPQDIHDSIRGIPGTFKKVIEGIEALERSKKLYNSDTPHITINFTISPMNHSRIVETVSILENLPIQSLIISHLWFTTQELGKQHENLYRELLQSKSHSWKGFLRKDISGIERDKLVEQLQKVKQHTWPFPITIVPSLTTEQQVTSYYTAPSNTLGYHRCLVPWRTASILPNGDVTPCSDRPDFIVGNITQMSFKEIWRSARYRQFRTVMKKKGLLPLCYRCCELFLG